MYKPKKEEFLMKNTIRVLGIAIILLVLVQLVAMFMPYFDFSDMVKPDRKGNIPQSQFTLQDYVWMQPEDMGKDFFKELIEDYNVNDHAVSLALTFVIGCVVVLLNAMNFTNSFRTFVTFRTGMIKVITHIVSAFWCYIAINAYLTSAVLTVPQADQQMYMISLNLIYVATGLVAVRLVADVATSIVAGNKARAARRAALEAA